MLDTSASAAVKQEAVSAELLYPIHAESGSPIVTAAFRLLREATELLDAALVALRGADRVTADYSCTRLHSLLPEMFCCRRIGDGYASAVAVAATAYATQAGIPFEENQLVALLTMFRALRAKPFMSLDTLDEFIEAMEKSGLSVEVPGYEQLATLFGNEDEEDHD
jgi:hypothetical protein